VVGGGAVVAPETRVVGTSQAAHVRLQHLHRLKVSLESYSKMMLIKKNNNTAELR